MSVIPDGVQTATGEGRDVQSAIEQVAKALGVEAHQVAHKLDMSHFRTNEGGVVARDTVKVIGWFDPNAKAEAPKPRPKAQDRDGDESENGVAEARERRPRDRDRDRDRPRDRDREPTRDRDREPARDRDRDRPRDPEEAPARRGAEAGTTEASDFAQAWFQGLLGFLEVPGTVEATGSTERVHIRVQPKDKAGRLIGRRGTTLAAIRHLLSLSLEQFGTFVIDVDVDDERGERPEPREARGPRNDRRGGRGEGRPRREESGGLPEDKLRALARRAAEKALETGKAITINLDLNSYDRRIVHVEVGEIEGVTTRSIEKDDKKVVQVVPE
jgi:predicted RNA-binding protein Jag